MILVSILVLGILIFVHELGHFLVAKWCGVGVLEFSVGFGRKIFKKRIGSTTYAIGLIPLGGYVRMVGDDPRQTEAVINAPVETLEHGEPDPVEISPEDQALLADRSKWFLLKPYLSKCAIVIAGPGFNLLFALLLAIGSVAYFGRPSTPPIIGEVLQEYPAAAAGLVPGDYVNSINGTEIKTWNDLSAIVTVSEGKPLTLSISRPNLPERLEIVVSAVPAKDGAVSGVVPYMLGIRNRPVREAVGLVEALKIGTTQIGLITAGTGMGLYQMFTGDVPASSIRGPIFIFGAAAQSARLGIEYLIDFMIFLSISLAVLNLLPIPILDGGHLVFFTIEKLKGGPVSLTVQQYANQFGMVVLMALMAFAMGNDLWDLFT